VTAPDDTDDRDEADDPIMRSMRSVWVSMRDEDPPTKGLTELLAAARTKAEEMQPKESWWRRTLATLVRPPVLALATVVVLVGGTVVITKRNADSELVPVAHAPASSRDELQDRERAPDPIVRLDKGEPEKPSGGFAAGSAAINESQPTVVPAPPAETKPPTVRPTRPPANPPNVARDPIEPKANQGRGGKFGGEDTTVTGQGTAQGPLVGRTTVPESPPKPGLEIANGDLAGEAAQDAKSPSIDPSTTKDVGTKITTQPRSGPSPVEQLVKQAEAAAERKDCPAVRVTVNRIKKLDANVYKDRVVKQAAIARCLK
jgi:hypothetical protein